MIIIIFFPSPNHLSPAKKSKTKSPLSLTCATSLLTTSPPHQYHQLPLMVPEIPLLLLLPLLLFIIFLPLLLPLLLLPLLPLLLLLLHHHLLHLLDFLLFRLPIFMFLLIILRIALFLNILGEVPGSLLGGKS